MIQGEPEYQSIQNDSSQSNSPDMMRDSDTEKLLRGSITVDHVYDSFIQKTGFNFKLFCIVTCSGIGLLSDTLEVMGISYAKNYIKNDFILTRLEESVLVGVLFAGMLIGGLFWGTAADIYGRRSVLKVSLGMNGTFAALSALSPNFALFCIARLFSGIGVGGSIPVIFSYVSEWSHSKIRGRVISTVATCWMVGTVLAAGFALAILPQGNQHYSQYWQPWRLYLVVCSVPSLVAALMYHLLPETPAFHLGRGETELAVAIMRNYSSDASHVSSEIRHIKRLVEDKETPRNRPLSNPGLLVSLKEMFLKIAVLFSVSLRRMTFICMIVILPVHFGYYGFMLWFPEYVKKTSGGGDGPDDDAKVFREGLYVAMASFPGNVLSIILSDIVGVKILLVVSLLLSAGSIFLLYAFHSPHQVLLLSCLFNGVSAPVFNMVDILLPALYPTATRTSAFGFHTSLIRVVMIIGNWLFAKFVDTSPSVPIVLTSALLLVSAIATLALPRLKAAH